MAALQSNIPDRQLFESSLPVAERVLALVLECLLEPLPLGPCITLYCGDCVGLAAHMALWAAHMAPWPPHMAQ